MSIISEHRLTGLALVGASAGTLILSLAGFFQYDSRRLFELSVATTEFGHWLAVVPLAVVLAALLLWPRRTSSRNHFLAVAMAMLAILCFFYPVLATYALWPQWRQELKETFGDSTVLREEPLSLARLWQRVRPIYRPSPRQLVYKTVEEQKLLIDFYPPQKYSGPAPWVLVIHGGGWTSGDQSQLESFNVLLAREGYAVASISYRLAPRWRWPAQLEDTTDAVKYLKAHAGELGLDARRWVVLGRSAGGQIAEAYAYSAHDSALKGCIAFYAPADLRAGYYWGREDDVLGSRGLLRLFLGARPEEAAELYKSASPLELADRTAPPTLLFHGRNDNLVSIRHSERLAVRLKELGVRNVLIDPPWAAHGFDFNMHGAGGQLSAVAIRHFLGAVLPASR